MTITIPDWVFWILGGIGGLVALGLMIFGVLAIFLLAKIGEGFGHWR